MCCFANGQQDSAKTLKEVIDINLSSYLLSWCYQHRYCSIEETGKAAKKT